MRGKRDREGGGGLGNVKREGEDRKKRAKRREQIEEMGKYTKNIHMDKQIFSKVCKKMESQSIDRYIDTG